MGVNLDRFKIGQTDDEYWSWFSVMLFLLIPLDILTTAFAIRLYGVEGELNPLMRVLFMADWHVFMIVNVGVAILAIGFFNGILEMGAITPYQYKRRFYLMLEIWMGGCIAFGMLLLVNNLMVVVWGRSLVTLVLTILATI